MVKGLFAESEKEMDAAGYANELEVALWASFKEILNGKEATGSRYK